MEPGWVKIYTSSDFFQSEIIRQVLVDHQIDTIMLNKQGFPYRMGEVELYIHEAHFEEALELIIQLNYL